METNPTLGVIGGSGLYRMPGVEAVREVEVETPFGPPSAPLVVGELAGRQVAFLARHGSGHRYSPTEINYRANIYALKAIGVRRVVAVSACGSLREDYSPGDLVIPDQLFDLTRHRKSTFFEGGLVAHIGIADPFCPSLSKQAFEAVQTTGAVTHHGGAMITIEGPRFSTRIESNVFRSWGMSVIGMTTSPEAFLAREAELCYTVIAHVTDYDVWHVTEEPVTVEIVMRTARKNIEKAREALRALAQELSPGEPCTCSDALAHALTTDPEAIPDDTRERLALLVEKYLDT